MDADLQDTAVIKVAQKEIISLSVEETSKDDCSPGPCEAGKGDCNPEPPFELIKQDVIDADNIGDTVFSKHKLFSLLMKLIQTVDGETEAKHATGEAALIDLDDKFQDELCSLWDMSMNSEVVCLLREFKAIDILTGIISKSCAPRATEICMGILGNMACSPDICRDIADNQQLVHLILMLLESPDAPTLVETTRFLNVCLSEKQSSDKWVAAIKKQADVFSNILFILRSSTNNDLLRNCVSLADNLMDADSTICNTWSSTDFVRAILEAVKQAGHHPSEMFNTVLHILQLVSTTETGMKALVADCDAICRLALQFLVALSGDDVMIVTGRQNVIASSLSVLSAVLPSWPGYHDELLSDFQLIRCLLKLLEAVASSTKHQGDDFRTEGKKDTQTAVDDSTRDNGEKHAESEKDDTDEREMMKMLHDLLTDLFVQIVVTLSEISSDVKTTHKMEPHAQAPKSLRYLDSMCSRQRIRYLVRTLQSNADGHVTTLKVTAAGWHLERLARIISDSMS